MGQKLVENDKIVVIADNREIGSNIEKIIESFGARVIVTNLEIADYILSNRVAVERKTVSDFINSIKDGRLFKQVEEMNRNFESPILIMEGNGLYSISNMHPNAIRGAISSLITDYKIPVLQTKGPEETASLMFWMAKREQTEEKKEISIRGKKRILAIKDYQEFLVAGLPKVSKVIARRLLNHFGSPANIFNASESDLCKVKGVGKSISKKIKLILESKHGG